MTPQQLIDLPGYGKAQEHLIKQGQWNDPKLKHQEMARKISDLAEELAERLEEQE